MSRSIWSTRITVLRMIMPASAINPSRATKPNGRLETSSAPVAPINPSGAVTNTRASREKRAIGLDAFLDRSAGLDAIAVGQGVLDPLEFRLNLVADVRCLHAVDDVAAHGQHHVAVAPPQDRLLVFVVEAGNLRQGHGDSVPAGDGQCRQPVELETFGRNRARDH